MRSRKPTNQDWWSMLKRYSVLLTQRSLMREVIDLLMESNLSERSIHQHAFRVKESQVLIDPSTVARNRFY